MEVLAIGGVVLLFVGGIYFIISQKKKIRQSFEGFAQAHGFEYHHSAFPRVTGTADDDREFSMGSYQAIDESGKRRPDLPVEFRVELTLKGTPPAGFETGRKGLLATSPMTLGDPAFDKKVWFTADDEEAAKAYLTPERREAAISLASLEGGVREGAIWTRRSGFKPRQAWMEDYYQKLLSAARAFDV